MNDLNREFWIHRITMHRKSMWQAEHRQAGMREYARNTARQKSQTPVITAFGFKCLGLSSPKVAAEGLEPPTRGL